MVYEIGFTQLNIPIIPIIILSIDHHYPIIQPSLSYYLTIIILSFHHHFPITVLSFNHDFPVAIMIHFSLAATFSSIAWSGGVSANRGPLIEVTLTIKQGSMYIYIYIHTLLNYSGFFL